MGTRSLGPFLSALLITLGMVILVAILTPYDNVVFLNNPRYEGGNVTVWGCIEQTRACRQGSGIVVFSAGDRCVIQCADELDGSIEITRTFGYRTGKPCLLLDRFIPAYESGAYAGIDFHKVECEGNIGFVGTQYVIPYGESDRVNR